MTPAQLGDYVTLMWVLLCGFLVMFMQAGFLLVSVGFARSRHAGHTALLNMLVFATSTLAYFAVGFAMQYGGSRALLEPTALGHLGGFDHLTREIGGPSWGVCGGSGFALAHLGPGALALFFFELMFLQTAAYIPIGSAMERIRIVGMLLITVVLSAVVFPLFANWCWGGGWLASLGRTCGLSHGFVDFAGSSVVHGTGGFAGLAIAIALGPRLGKFNRDRKPMAMPGHNLPLVVLGSLVLLFGWMGFNCGSTLDALDANLPRIAINTILAASSGCLAAVATIWRQYGKPDIGIAASGLLAGAVAVTAPCAFVSPWAAIIIGLVAGVIMCLVISAMEWKGRIDDPSSAISVHGICGTWGAISVGLFANGSYGTGWNGVAGSVRGLFYGDPWQLGAQLIGVSVNFVFVFLTIYGACILIARVFPLRPTGRQESDGLDMGECGSPAYPDFSTGGLSSLGRG